jgi:hypothetical protein
LSDRELHARVVSYILDNRPEYALKLLSEYYGVSEPGLRVGSVKGHRKVVACYVEKERRIYLSRSELLTDPFVILHEFYHHLRASSTAGSKQVDKRADLFALNFIRDSKRFRVKSTS